MKAGIFDFGGVVVNDTNEKIYLDIAKAFSVDYELVASTMQPILDKFQTGKITEKEFWVQFSKRIGRNLPEGYEDLWSRIYRKETHVIPEVRRAIQKLRKNNYKLALLSNTIPPHVNYNREQGNYIDFDVIVLSCDPSIRMRKPYESIYWIPLKLLDVLPEECFYVDDHLENLTPAEKIGMKTIHFKESMNLESELEKIGIRL